MTKRGWATSVLLISLLLIICHESPAAQQSEASKTIRAVRVEASEAPVFDGHLNETVWQQATSAHVFLQREPQEGKPATERTEIRVLYDDEHLYLSIFCYDREPQKIIANEKGRDASLDSDDSFSFVLDTFGDRRTAYLFTINPLGARYDAVVSPGGLDVSWNGVWDVWSAQVEDGWSAEVLLPFKTLRFRRGAQQIWGINFARMIRRKNEEVLWSSYRRNQGITRLAHAGILAGLNLPPPPSWHFGCPATLLQDLVRLHPRFQRKTAQPGS